MRVLQINATYGSGSTGKIVRDISEQLLSSGHQAFAMWGSACKPDDKCSGITRIGNTLDHKLHALLRRIDKKQAFHSKLATKIACRKIKKLKPDIVHLHNLHSNYLHLPTLLEFLGKNDIPTLLTLHDCWFFTGGCGHYSYHNCQNWETGCNDCAMYKKAAAQTFALKKNLFGQIKHLAINGVSKWTAELAKNSFLNSANIITYIHNWIDTDLFKPSDSKEKVKELYNIPASNKIILGVAQGWSDNKGLREFIKIASELKDSATVVLVGDSTNIPDKSNLRCIDYISNINDLIDLYSAADVLVNPSKVETFGLVTAEALACGTPVVAYNNTGTSEIVTDDCGALVENQNSDALLSTVLSVLEKGKENYSAACRDRILNHFEKENQTKKYINLYKDILDKKS